MSDNTLLEKARRETRQGLVTLYVTVFLTWLGVLCLAVWVGSYLYDLTPTVDAVSAYAQSPTTGKVYGVFRDVVFVLTGVVVLLLDTVLCSEWTWKRVEELEEDDNDE